ncbi:FKBP8-like protein [Mya arenaria]|uniref:FKBP8-like protein n=1 Tax=Mya arenaria TaxID=6604 RepID=A0ABY7DU49_MYAAR|nr:FKBP8-like protein [Mya arenaria]
MDTTEPLKHEDTQDKMDPAVGASGDDGDSLGTAAPDSPMGKQAPGDGPSSEASEGTQDPEDEYTDILGNKTLLKKVLTAGTGPRPNMQERVKIILLQEMPELGTTLPEQTLEFVLGQGDVAQALDLAVALMNIGEKAQVISGYQYMYGEVGMPPDVPAKTNFKLTVTLLEKKKERGNYYFRRKEFERSINSYSFALKVLEPENLRKEGADNLQKALEFRAIVQCNNSAAFFKLEAYEPARKAAEESIKLLASHTKAYIRLGQAQEKLGNADKAIVAYKKALEQDATNKWLHSELSRLTKVNHNKKKDQREMYSKMFWGSNPPDMSNSGKAKPSKAEPVNWLKLGGLGFIGFILTGLASFGIQRYLNQS